MAETLKSLIGMTKADLAEVAQECGLPRFAAGQMARWLYVKRVKDIDDMTDLSLRGRQELKKRYCVGRQEPVLRTLSSDGTAKYLFPGAGGRDIESVMIPDGDRATLCVSSQAGCRMNCRFCMTGRQGFHGNLTPTAIINQVLSVEESEQLTNIVYMGMGEPTDNAEAVLKSIEILTAPWGMAWSPKRITLSSIGRIDVLRRIIEQTNVHIAISVHSPFSAEREEIMPVERAYPLTAVVDMLRGFDWAHQRRLSVEYIMWRGKNDTPRHADALARLLRGLHCRVNLIRFHPIEGFDRESSSREVMEAFRDRLNAAGITATIRASRGEDIMAACGQLAGKAKSSPHNV